MNETNKIKKPNIVRGFSTRKPKRSPEQKVIDKSVKLWESFLKIKNKHPDLDLEFRISLHRIQDMIYSKMYTDNLK